MWYYIANLGYHNFTWLKIPGTYSCNNIFSFCDYINSKYIYMKNTVIYLQKGTL